MNNQHYHNSIFWIEVDKIKPNPYQPRKEFDEAKLQGLAESIKQYGVLQPLVVTRKEVEKPDGGLMVEYELIAGERRLRASNLANLQQVPAVIRTGEDDDKMKLELAIIENLQREDLNPVDRAKAFQRLVDDFNFKHVEIAKKIGKSREYVSNSLRLLTLPEEILEAVKEGKLTEGHTRPILMLNDRPEEQMTLFKEVVFKKLTVREAEGIARRIAQDKIRKKDLAVDPEIIEIEGRLTEDLGTRVQIDKREVGGKITIDFFSNDDLKAILEIIDRGKGVSSPHAQKVSSTISAAAPTPAPPSGGQEAASVSPVPPNISPREDGISNTAGHEQAVPYAQYPQPAEGVAGGPQAPYSNAPQADFEAPQAPTPQQQPQYAPHHPEGQTINRPGVQHEASYASPEDTHRYHDQEPQSVPAYPGAGGGNPASSPSSPEAEANSLPNETSQKDDKDDDMYFIKNFSI